MGTVVEYKVRNTKFILPKPLFAHPIWLFFQGFGIAVVLDVAADARRNPPRISMLPCLLFTGFMGCTQCTPALFSQYSGRRESRWAVDILRASLSIVPSPVTVTAQRNSKGTTRF